jgi:TatD DNase family protein
MMTQWIDSHCHLDAPEFSVDRAAVLKRAQDAGVNLCVMPAVQAKDFVALQAMAKSFHQPYALGIHPLYVPQAQADDLVQLENLIQQALSSNLDGQATDPRLVALGEIGLDFYVPALCEPDMREKQLFFYHAQLKLAHKYKLPVILHVRRSQDAILKALRRRKIPGGIAHAFNGSFQQAEQFIELGFKLGFGGAATYQRALQIRRLLADLPIDSIVTETDSPDIPPAWLKGEGIAFNEPAFMARIAKELAAIRGMSDSEFAATVWRNAMQVLPRWAALCAGNPNFNLAS